MRSSLRERECPAEEWKPDELLPAERKVGEFQIGLKNLHPGSGPAVLLVHGASASHRTFLWRAGPRGLLRGGLAEHLRAEGRDVWALDWRGSGLLSPRLIDGGCRALDFTLDRASCDLLLAIDTIAGHKTKQKNAPSTAIDLVGHCIGGALVAQTLSTWNESPYTQTVLGHVRNVVLTTLGLFFSSGIDDRVKGNERFIEQSWFGREDREAFISPWVGDCRYGNGWPTSFEEAFALWKKTPLVHECDNDFCHRAGFMFGQPYRPHDIAAIHDAQPLDVGGLGWQFGRMPLGTYLHCVQNLRRGWVAPWDAPDNDISYLNPAPFATRNVTLLTGNENQVWHRDSIDRMHEWLLRECPAQRANFTKHVLPHYGHQDLYWSSNAATDVYPKIVEGLNRSPPR